MKVKMLYCIDLHAVKNHIENYSYEEIITS